MAPGDTWSQGPSRLQDTKLKASRRLTTLQSGFSCISAPSWLLWAQVLGTFPASSASCLDPIVSSHCQTQTWVWPLRPHFTGWFPQPQCQATPMAPALRSNPGKPGSSLPQYQTSLHRPKYQAHPSYALYCITVCHACDLLCAYVYNILIYKEN